LSPEVFSELDIQPRTRSALKRIGITSPTPIQEQAIPWLNKGGDLVGQAQTGSGKTLAFGIPLVEGCNRSAPGVQGLVLVPTRELAIQVASVLEEVAERRVSVTLLYGGRPLGGEKRTLQKGTQIIVGTPGRTLDHLRQGTLWLGSLRMLVLDEADEMLDRGFARDVEAIIAETAPKRQTALFSATLPDWVAKTSKKHLRDPKTVRVVSNPSDALKIEHLIYKIDKASKAPALQALLDQRGDAPILVFGKTKHGVKKLAKQLAELGYPAVALQGNLSQNARERVMLDFRSGLTPVLVATNVAARGLDVEGIAQVINYDLPDSLQLFTHRVGRTGRMGKSGEAITFVTPDEESKWRVIERGFDTQFTVKRWGPNGPQDSMEPAPAAQRRVPGPTRMPRRAPTQTAADSDRSFQQRRPWHSQRQAG
jgi:ATP-dependent RNA helicase DeaD